MTIRVDRRDDITVVTIDRPEARNAVNPAMARALFDAFVAFDKDESQAVAILAGIPGAFCAGFDLKEASAVGEDWFAAHDLGSE
jgi:enoyl-CoA hydratase